MALINEVKRPPRRPSSQNKKSGRIITVCALVILITCGVVLFDYLYQDWRNKKIIEEAQKLQSQVTDPPLSQVEELPLTQSAMELLAQNPDTAGWITVPNTKIDLPVVKPQDAENSDFYLTHNFLQEKNRAGAIYADYRTTLTGSRQSDNVVLYGHNELNNTMFGDLDKYKNGYYGSLDFYKQSPTFTFSSNYETAEYKIIAYFVISALPEHETRTEFFDYQNYIDFTEERYNDFIQKVMTHTKILTDVDVQYGDHFVTLSTCSKEFEDARFVVIGRKVRDGESSYVDVEKAQTNPDALDPDWNLIFKG